MEEIILYYTVLDSIKHSLLTLWGDIDSEFYRSLHTHRFFYPILSTLFTIQSIDIFFNLNKSGEL